MVDVLDHGAGDNQHLFPPPSQALLQAGQPLDPGLALVHPFRDGEDLVARKGEVVRVWAAWRNVPAHMNICFSLDGDPAPPSCFSPAECSPRGATCIAALQGLAPGPHAVSVALVDSAPLLGGAAGAPLLSSRRAFNLVDGDAVFSQAMAWYHQSAAYLKVGTVLSGQTTPFSTNPNHPNPPQP